MTAEQKAIIEADLLLAMTAGATATSEQRGKFLARLAIGDFEFERGWTCRRSGPRPHQGPPARRFLLHRHRADRFRRREQLMLLLEDDELAVQPA